MVLSEEARAPRPVAGRQAPARTARPKLALTSASALSQAMLRHRARALALAAGLLIGAASLFVVAGQAMVASQQVRIDTLHDELAGAVASNENLQLTKAQLEAPGRVLIIAERQLHMVVPKAVVYLDPVNPGPSIEAYATAHQR